MGQRKTRKEKIRSQEREKKRQKQIYLDKKIADYNRQIESNKNLCRKYRNVKNLKIASHTFFFASLFSLSLSATSLSLYHFFNRGGPFVIDKLTKYKISNLEYESGSVPREYDTYEIPIFKHDTCSSGTIEVTSFLQYEEPYYEYVQKTFDSSFDDLSYIDMVKNEINLDFLDSTEHKEQVIRTNRKLMDRDTYVSASLHIADLNHPIMEEETLKNNVEVTISYLIFSFLLDSLCGYYLGRNDIVGYIKSIREGNDEYKRMVSENGKEIQVLQEMLSDCLKLKLSDMKGGNIQNEYQKVLGSFETRSR